MWASIQPGRHGIVVISLHFRQHGRVGDQGLDLLLLIGGQDGGHGFPDFAAGAPGILCVEEDVGNRVVLADPGRGRGVVGGLARVLVNAAPAGTRDWRPCRRLMKLLHEQRQGFSSRNTLPLLMKDFVTSGKVCIVSHEFPLDSIHKYSHEAANIATAAARIGKYDVVANALFHAQESWEVSGKVWETVAAVPTPDQQKKVQALAKDPSVVKEVQDDVAYGTGAGVNETPTLFVSLGLQALPGGRQRVGIQPVEVDDR